MSILVIGIGNQFRSDDAVGLQIADSLSELNLSDCTVQRSAGEGIALINMWENYDYVILIDAVKSDSKPGTIHQLDLLHDKLDSDWFQTSSHLFALPEAIKLSKVLQKLPKVLKVYGIEGINFDNGVDLSEEIQSAKTEVIALLQEEILQLTKVKL